MQKAQSISELTHLIQSVLENELEPVYWVIGEIADFRQAPQGHAYFELVEKQGNQVMAKIKANLWQFTYRTVAVRFEFQTGSGLKNGMKVLAQVNVNYHPVYGLSINVKDIDPSFSLGERARIRQETIDRLTREGLLRLNADLQLPILVQKIAIISSPTAAGYGDFINQIEHNPNGYKIYYRLFPSMMQGNEAVASLVQAITQAESMQEKLQLEAIVIIRGGGAQLDLDCFDDYRVAAKIANCPLLVFTGIGHERDETIADLVAHTRLKTPTAVAEFLLSGFREFEENLGIALTRLDRATRQKLREEDSLLNQFSHRIVSGIGNRLNLEKEKLASKTSRISSVAKNQLGFQTIQLDSLEKNFKKALANFLKKENDRLESRITSLRQLNPMTIFARGYTRSEINGVPVSQTKAEIGDQLMTHTSGEKISSTITHIEEK